jgi:SAM-dependent methyltransferase
LIFRQRYPHADLKVFDFYDPKKHTEVSIKRARKAYEPYPNTKNINTDFIPLAENSTDVVFNIFSLHEVRNREERINFLKRQHRSLKDDGRCIIVEHLRDLPNFIAYNIGFFHFLSPHEWKNNFLMAGFEIGSVIKVTPFVSVFILNKSNGYTS